MVLFNRSAFCLGKNWAAGLAKARLLKVDTCIIAHNSRFQDGKQGLFYDFTSHCIVSAWRLGDIWSSACEMMIWAGLASK